MKSDGFNFKSKEVLENFLDSGLFSKHNKKVNRNVSELCKKWFFHFDDLKSQLRGLQGRFWPHHRVPQCIVSEGRVPACLLCIPNRTKSHREKSGAIFWSSQAKPVVFVIFTFTSKWDNRCREYFYCLKLQKLSSSINCECFCIFLQCLIYVAAKAIIGE